MTYETAKKLKDAGFKQEGLGFLMNGNVYAPGFSELTSDLYYPTLSELIEACGGGSLKIERFSHVTRGIVWQVYLRGKEKTEQTLEEAVANLWMALNEKKQ